MLTSRTGAWASSYMTVRCLAIPMNAYMRCGPRFFYCLFGEIWTLTNYYQNKTLIRPNEKNYYLLNSGPIFYIMYS